MKWLVSGKRGTDTAYDGCSVRSNQACYSGGSYGREISRSRGQVAQLVEHVTENHGVAGSIPALATSLRSVFSRRLSAVALGIHKRVGGRRALRASFGWQAKRANRQAKDAHHSAKVGLPH